MVMDPVLDSRVQGTFSTQGRGGQKASDSGGRGGVESTARGGGEGHFISSRRLGFVICAVTACHDYFAMYRNACVSHTIQPDVTWCMKCRAPDIGLAAPISELFLLSLSLAFSRVASLPFTYSRGKSVNGAQTSDTRSTSTSSLELFEPASRRDKKKKNSIKNHIRNGGFLYSY